MRPVRLRAVPTPPPAALDAASRGRLAAFYRSALRRYGPGHTMSVWWVNAATQQRRFAVLAEVGPWDGASVLDVGCGLGDLFAFLDGRGLSVRYLGCDMLPEMVAAARKKHPQPRARFEVRDVVEHPLPRRFDYVVACGTFNLRVEGHEDYLRSAIASMYGSCRRAVAFNFLTPVPPGHPDAEVMQQLNGDLFYHLPLPPLLEWCRGLARRVEVRTGYREFDASLLLFR